MASNYQDVFASHKQQLTFFTSMVALLSTNPQTNVTQRSLLFSPLQRLPSLRTPRQVSCKWYWSAPTLTACHRQTHQHVSFITISNNHNNYLYSTKSCLKTILSVYMHFSPVWHACHVLLCACMSARMHVCVCQFIPFVNDLLQITVHAQCCCMPPLSNQDMVLKVEQLHSQVRGSSRELKLE